MRLPLARLSSTLALLAAAGLATTSFATAPLTGASVDPPRRDPEPQTSDGVVGTVAEPVHGRVASRPIIKKHRKRRVAPGVTYEKWRQTDPPRDPVRVHVLRIDPSVKGVKLDYGGPAQVPDTQRVRRMVVRQGAVAGVNADFFDIRDTLAPLGNGVQRGRGLLHGRRDTWTTSFFIDRDGKPHIRKLPVVATIKQHPRWKIAHLNSPTVWPDQIGIYTARWGTLAGKRVTDNQDAHVRQVLVQQGRVVSNENRLTRDEPIQGRVLMGRGGGADKLEKLEVGSRLGFDWTFEGDPPIVISGSEVLLRNRQIRAQDDVYQHPRTAIGFNRETGRIILAVVDGRSESSRGYTLVELARLMKQQGCELALNFDGGGSSTMVATFLDGTTKVRNVPSDGHPRKVANSLLVHGAPWPDGDPSTSPTDGPTDEPTLEPSPSPDPGTVVR